MRWWVFLFPLVVVVCLSVSSAAEQDDLREEIEALKARIEVLEKRLSQQRQEGRAEDIKAVEEEIKDIKETLVERLGSLSIHGSVVGYYQGMTDARIGGERFDNPDGAGFSADLELSFSPIEGGEFYLRLHAGEGDGSDRDLEELGGLFADLNTLNDDNPEGQFLDLLEAHYTQTFLNGRLGVTLGKGEPVAFIDENAFANDEATQFVGKPFVNDPVLDSEDEYGPLVAFRAYPVEGVSVSAVFQSSSHAGKKGVWEEVFQDPFVGVQVSYSPKISGCQGNWRLYGWAATYDHMDLDEPGKYHRGWGIGVSADQWLSKRVGLFARAGYHEEEVYPVSWFWSGGLHIVGPLPGREKDQLGFGVAGLVASPDLDHAAVDTGLLLSSHSHATEYHLEAYYRIVISDCLAITPDLQYVIDPLGEARNDNVFAGMLKGEFGF